MRRDRDDDRIEKGLVPWNQTGKNGRRESTLENSKEAKLVKEWKGQHPDSKNKSACARDTGLTRPTVRKWWNAIETGVIVRTKKSEKAKEIGPNSI